MVTQQPELPNNRNAEEILIGSILRWPEDFISVDIDAEDFYLIRHQYIWKAFESLAAKGTNLDTFTVGSLLETRGQLQAVGGHEYLNSMDNIVPFGHRAEDSAAIIREMASRRKVLILAQEMAKTAYDYKADIESKSGDFLNAMVGTVQLKTGAVHWSRFISDLWEEVEERSKEPKDIWGIPTGFTKFDEVTGGLHMGELMIVSGKPGVGKSILEMQRAAQMARHAPGAIYSIEMSGKQVMRRIVSAQAKVRASGMKSGRLQDDDYSKIITAIEELHELPVYMSDATGWSTTSMRADLARLKAAYGVQWFLVDYLSLMSDASDQDIDSRPSIISRRLKLLCRNLDLAGIAVHSMNKAGIEAKTPGQEHLSGRANVSFDADLICFLTEFKPMSVSDESIPEKDRANLRTFWFAKGREMEDDKKYIHMVKLPGWPAFGDYAPEPNAQRVK